MRFDKREVVEDRDGVRVVEVTFTTGNGVTYVRHTVEICVWHEDFNHESPTEPAGSGLAQESLAHARSRAEQVRAMDDFQREHAIWGEREP